MNFNPVTLQNRPMICDQNETNCKEATLAGCALSETHRRIRIKALNVFLYAVVLFSEIMSQPRSTLGPSGILREGLSQGRCNEEECGANTGF